MANKKRTKKTYYNRLDRYHLTRKNILAIEKILRGYADVKEMQYSGITNLPDDSKRMRRRAVDRYVSIGRYSPFHITLGRNEFGIHYAGVEWIYHEDSIKFFTKPTHPKRTRYMEIAAWPGIRVTFRPFSTTIYAQTHYASSGELMVMNSTLRELENYFMHHAKRSAINHIDIAKRQLDKY